MKLSPNDIGNKEFKKKFRGYKREEVDDYLADISDDFKQLYKENSIMKDRIAVLEERLKHYKDMEDNIQKTLLMAQSAAEDAKRNARKESDLALHNANEASAKIIEKAKDDVISVNKDYDKVKAEFVKFRSKFRHFMNSQMDMFETLERDFEKTSNVGRLVSSEAGEEVAYTSFKKQIDKPNEGGKKLVAAGRLSEFKHSQKADTVENIKTFFSEQ